MVILRPKGQKPSKVVANVINLPENYKKPAFVIHPPTSKLAEQLVVDSTALQDENYSGIYDESGDYIPQYCDNPEEIPQGTTIAPNSEDPGTVGGAKASEQSNESSVESQPGNEESK